MDIDMKFIKTFETFHKEEFEKLVALNKTYIRKKPYNRHPQSEDLPYKDIIIKIKNYDVTKLVYDKKKYNAIKITPDEGFKKLLNELNTHLIEKIPDDIFFWFTYDPEELNQIEFTEGIPRELWGISFGYKLYKLVIKDIKYFTTNRSSSPKAYNIWYNLMLDKDLYCYTSTIESGAIHKNISNRELFSFLEKIKNKDLIFDPELTEKIIELYGSMDIYTQRN